MQLSKHKMINTDQRLKYILNYVFELIIHVIDTYFKYSIVVMDTYLGLRLDLV